MSEFNLTKIWLPGLFLLILGFGNISVGVFKGDQYKQVVEELSTIAAKPKLATTSPLHRIQLADRIADRRYQRQNKAKARLDYYNLVVFGGQIFVGAGLTLITIALVLQLRRITRRHSHARLSQANGQPLNV